MTVEIRFNLSQDAFETLQSLAEKHNTTMTEVLHHAISLESFFDKEINNGGNVLIENGAESRRVVLWS